MNLGDDNIDIHQGTRLATAELLDPDDVTIQTIAQAGHSTSSTEGPSNQLWEMVQSNDNMGELDKNKLYHLLVAYSDVFAADKTDLGRTNQIQHKIETGEASPIRQ